MTSLIVPLNTTDPELVPTYAHETDAGADLRAAREMTIRPGEQILVPTGVTVAIPAGYVGLIHPRSGLAWKHGITVLNTPGTIDADYRGEISVILIHHGKEAYKIKKYDRIAQLVFQKVEHAVFVDAHSLDETLRGTGGFGSTGVSDAKL